MTDDGRSQSPENQGNWWDIVHSEDREMAIAICEAHETESAHRLVYPGTPMMAMSPRGPMPVIEADKLIPLWVMFLWQARAAIRLNGTSLRCGGGDDRVKIAEDQASQRPWPLEVRRNDDGSLDEVVCDGAYVHLEQMDYNHWWMAVEWQGKLFHINLTAKGKINARCEEQ